MKKIYISILALCLFICANAAPAFTNKAAKMNVDVNTIGVKKCSSFAKQLADKRLNTLGISLEQLDLSKLPADAPVFKMHQEAFAAPVARKAANANTVNMTIKEGDALYLGLYFYALEGKFYGDIWELEFTTNEGYEIYVQFTGISNERIEGKYTPAYATVVAGNDTTDAEGALNIAYFGAGTTVSPTYSFSGAFIDEQGNMYNLSGNYAFPNGAVFDYYYAYMCYQGYSQACSLVDIILQDKPVEPTGDTIPVTILGNAKKSFYPEEGWSVYAQDNDVYFTTFINSETLAGTYTDPDMFDMANTQFVALEDTTVIELKQINKAIIIKNGSNYSFRFFAMDLDGTIWDIQMKYTLPVPVGDTITLNAIGTALYNDLREDYGIILVQGEDTTNHCFISNAIYADSLSGLYTQMDGYNGNYYDYIVVYTENDTIEYDADRYAVVLDSVVTQGGFVMLYHTMLFIGVNPEDDSDVKAFMVQTAAVQPFAIDSKEDVSATFNSSISETVITSLHSQFEVVIVRINDVNGYLYGWVFPKTLDPVLGLPAGTYPIEDTYRYNTMLASSGISMTDWTFNEPTYFMNQDGIWYIVDGTMTMSANSLVINGVNSNGKKVDITVNFNATDNEQVQENSQLVPAKMFFNNHLMIMKNNKFFNANGLELK